MLVGAGPLLRGGAVVPRPAGVAQAQPSVVVARAHPVALVGAGRVSPGGGLPGGGLQVGGEGDKCDQVRHECDQVRHECDQVRQKC